MERFIFSCVAVVGMLLGVCMAIRPARVVAWNRDEGNSRPASAGEIGLTRILGMAFAAGAGFGLYDLLTRAAGAEFFPV